MAEFIASLTAALTILIVVGLAPEAPAAGVTVAGAITAEVPVSLNPAIVLVGADDDQTQRVVDATDRFRAGGLELPDLEVRFSDDGSHCKGHYGLFQPQFDPFRVTVCSELPFVISHEFAHAWETANMTDAQRDQYLDRRELTNWNDPAAEWKDRGVEDVAFIIQQNLMATTVNLDSERWQQRTAAYEILTGSPSPLLD